MDINGYPSNNRKIATLGGGCFWCLEAVYVNLQGVFQVVSGYAGGSIPAPSYKQVCTGTTGHAEVIQVTFNPTVITFRELLEVFFSVHDPTTPNRQGNDVGTQYRSVVFCHNSEQKELAEQIIAELDAQQLWPAPIVTEITPLREFYLAEDYHQNYYVNNSFQGYCQVVINPKVTKFRQKFANKLKTK